MNGFCFGRVVVEYLDVYNSENFGEVCDGIGCKEFVFWFYYFVNFFVGVFIGYVKVEFYSYYFVFSCLRG